MKKSLFFTLGLFALGTLAFAGGGKEGGAAPRAGEPARITVEVFDRGTDGGKSNPANNEWTKWIKEKFLKDENIVVDFQPVNRWDETNALNILMAAGTAPDVCYTYNNEQIMSYARQGGIFDMTSTDTLLKDLNEFLGPDPSIEGDRLIRRYMDRDNGKIYMITNRLMYTTSQNIFIRKDWLDTLGLPLPSTPQQYYDALLAFKEKDPGGVGKDRVIPFTMTTDVRWSAGIILDSHIDPYLTPRERWINTVVDRYMLVSGYKEGMRYLNRMYNAGLIDKDFPLYKSEDIMLNLVKSGVVGSLAGDWDKVYRENQSILTDLQKNIPHALFVPIDPMKSADGLTHKRGGEPAGALVTFIPSTCKNPEAAMRYMNWMSKFENYHFLQVGREGVNHQIVNGVPKVIPATGGWIQNSNANVDYTLCINGFNLGSPELNAKIVANGYPWPPEYITDAYRISSLNAKPEPVFPVTLTAAAPLAQTLLDMASVTYVEAITAKPADFDRVWASGVDAWLKAGAQAVIDERRVKLNTLGR